MCETCGLLISIHLLIVKWCFAKVPLATSFYTCPYNDLAISSTSENLIRGRGTCDNLGVCIYRSRTWIGPPPPMQRIYFMLLDKAVVRWGSLGSEEPPQTKKGPPKGPVECTKRSSRMYIKVHYNVPKGPLSAIKDTFQT